MLRLVENEHFEGKLQNATLKLESSKLVISFVYTVKAKELVTLDNNSAVGIERGVAYPCAISNGTFADRCMSRKVNCYDNDIIEFFGD